MDQSSQDSHLLLSLSLNGSCIEWVFIELFNVYLPCSCSVLEHRSLYIFAKGFSTCGKWAKVYRYSLSYFLATSTGWKFKKWPLDLKWCTMALESSLSLLASVEVAIYGLRELSAELEGAYCGNMWELWHPWSGEVRHRTRLWFQGTQLSWVFKGTFS